MRAIIQKVVNANVSFIDNQNQAQRHAIENGLVVFVGITHTDSDKDISYIADKIINMRIFTDQDDKMNLSVKDVFGKVLLISQFTLYADLRQGRRPSFTQAAKPTIAKPLYEKLIQVLKSTGITIATGQFQTHMNITLNNDGPITLMIDSNKNF